MRLKKYIPNLRKIEIDLTYDCNLRCHGCDRSCNQAPEEKHISLQAIESFLQETEALCWEWESVHLLGGEPTLHPNFHDIVQLLDHWFQKNSPDTDLKVISNGYGEFVQTQLNQLPKHWKYTNSFKDSPEVEHFEAFNLAPIDFENENPQDYSLGCWITSYCGIGLTPQGYFPCAVAGGIDRIINLNAGFSSFEKSIQEYEKLLDTYCRYCGHFLNESYRPRTQRTHENVKQQSPFWQRAYKKFRLFKKQKTDRSQR